MIGFCKHFSRLLLELSGQLKPLLWELSSGWVFVVCDFAFHSHTTPAPTSPRAKWTRSKLGQTSFFSQELGTEAQWHMELCSPLVVPTVGIPISQLVHEKVKWGEREGRRGEGEVWGRERYGGGAEDWILGSRQLSSFLLYFLLKVWLHINLWVPRDAPVH